MDYMPMEITRTLSLEIERDGILHEIDIEVRSVTSLYGADADGNRGELIVEREILSIEAPTLPNEDWTFAEEELAKLIDVEMGINEGGFYRA